MKLPLHHQRRPRSHDGSSVIVMIVLLGIIFMYVAANLKTLGYLKRELNLVERRQIQRIQPVAPPDTSRTNSLAMDRGQR